jgi:hypothetical protein
MWKKRPSDGYFARAWAPVGRLRRAGDGRAGGREWGSRGAGVRCCGWESWHDAARLDATRSTRRNWMRNPSMHQGSTPLDSMPHIQHLPTYLPTRHSPRQPAIPQARIRAPWMRAAVQLHDHSTIRPYHATTIQRSNDTASEHAIARSEPLTRTCPGCWMVRGAGWMYEAPAAARERVAGGRAWMLRLG